MKNNADNQPAVFAKMRRIAEAFYGSAHDPDQIQITELMQQKLATLHPQSVHYKLIENEPVSWVVVVPTTKDLANQFMQQEITERGLLDRTQPQEVYDALYLCSAFTVPPYRQKGLATKLLNQAIKSMPLTQNALLFGWVFSPEGEALHYALSREQGLKIPVRPRT
jgi:hypothetical protein